MDRNDIRQILELARGRGIAEITVGIDGGRVRLAIPAQTSGPDPGTANAPEPVGAPAKAAPALIRAPMVGIFRRTETTPDPGGQAEPGAVVGEIESMGLRNEIVCEVGGLVTEAFVEDGQPVEYGQPIIAVQQVEEA
jgi:acetyl-CoA carboxylase biotin carboxyl carrier protein